MLYYKILDRATIYPEYSNFSILCYSTVYSLFHIGDYCIIRTVYYTIYLYCNYCIYSIYCKYCIYCNLLYMYIL